MPIFEPIKFANENLLELAQSLLKDGFVSPNQMGSEADVNFLLGEYHNKDPHVQVSMETNLFNEQLFIAKLKQATAKAEEDKRNQTLLGVFHNGYAHFVAYKIILDPIKKKMSLEVTDSQEPTTISEQHFKANENLMLGLVKAANSIEYSLTNPHGALTYTGEQENDANCPMHAARTVMRECHSIAPASFASTYSNEQAVAATQINKLKTVMLQNQVSALAKIDHQFESINPAKITSDEFGIIHLNDGNPRYKAHRANYEKVNTPIEFGNNRSEKGFQKNVATLTQISSDQVVLNKKLVILEKNKLALQKYNFEQTANELLLLDFQVKNFSASVDEKTIPENQFQGLKSLTQEARTSLQKNLEQLVTLSDKAAVIVKNNLAAEVSTRIELENPILSIEANNTKENRFKQFKAETLTLFGKPLNWGDSDEAHARILQNQELISYYESEGKKTHHPS